MNQRIKELAKQVDACYIPRYDMWQMDTETMEKFAELIVQECKRAIDPTGDLTSMSEAGWRKACMKMIDEHFGVEE
jgi:hypothetical protein